MSGDLQRAQRALERFKLFGDQKELTTVLSEILDKLQELDNRSPRLIGSEHFAVSPPVKLPKTGPVGAQPYDVPLPLEFGS